MQQQNMHTQQMRAVKRVTDAQPQQHVPNLAPASSTITPARVRWQWENDAGGFTPYAPHVIAAIEHAYTTKCGMFDIPHTSFRIVFSKMMQVLCSV